MPSSSHAPSYSAVLRTRHAARTFGAALLGRLSYGMVPLSLMLAVKGATGSYPVAGAVMALFGLTSVLLSPIRAALIDRYGPRRALPPMAAAYTLLLAVLAYATWRPGASGLLLGTLAVTAGMCTPPLGPVMRTLWSNLLPDRQLLQRSYSLDSVAEELLFVTGPLLVGLVMEYAVPAAGVAAGAALVLTGTFALVSSPATRGTCRPAAERTLPSASADGFAPDPAHPAPRRRRLRGAGLRHAVVVSAGVGLSLGALDLLVVAFAEQQHQAEAAAWVLAALSAGSAVGGLLYGAVSWRLSGRLLLPALATALGLSLAVAGLSPTVPVLLAVVGIAGLFVAPAITTAYLVADESADQGSRTQAGAWVNTALNAGSSAGTTAVGLTVGRLPLPACFALAAVPALLCATAVVGRICRPRAVAATLPYKTPACAGEQDCFNG